MEEVPVEARGALDARALAEELTVALPNDRWPRTWAPSRSFESLLAEVNKELAQLDSSLAYLRGHWDMRPSVAPVRGDSGPKAQLEPSCDVRCSRCSAVTSTTSAR